MRSKGGGQTFTEQARRRQIVDCAIETIAELGFGRASIARIAERVGVAKSVVLYHFATKDALVSAILEQVMAGGAQVMVPAMLAEETAGGRLAAYIRANCAYLDTHRTASVAMYEILTNFRTSDGLRLDQAAARAVAEEPPQGEMALLDPIHIFEEGMSRGEFAAASPLLMKNALRAALDGAVSELARDIEYDVIAYGELLVTIFDRATRSAP
jgi:TetR/AcrR family transcriptional regulator, fatty acid metabolism regulator protein